MPPLEIHQPARHEGFLFEGVANFLTKGGKKTPQAGCQRQTKGRLWNVPTPPPPPRKKGVLVVLLFHVLPSPFFRDRSEQP